MNLQENIQRIKEMMGLLTEDVENNDCYPSDYEPGKMYERDDLAKMFYCFADGKFPLEWIKESQFPKLPPFVERKEYISPKYDPKNMQIGKDEFVTMPEFVELNTKNIEVETEELKQQILEQSEYIHDFLIDKHDIKKLDKNWLIGLDSDKAGILMHLYMAPHIIEVDSTIKAPL